MMISAKYSTFGKFKKYLPDILIYSLLLSLAFVIFSLENAMATTILTAADGASVVTLADGSTVTTASIGGAYATTVTTSGDGTKTIDSCSEIGASTTTPQPCSFASIYPSLTLTMYFKTNTSALMNSSSVVTVKASGGTTSISGTASTVAGDGTFSFATTWTNLCTALGNTACTTSDSVNSSIVLTIASASGTPTESVTVNIYMRYFDTTLHTQDTYTSCASTPQATGGFCNFGIFPGDQKVFLSNILASTAFPTTYSGSMKYTQGIFFYRPAAAGSGNSVTLADSYFVSDVNEDKKPSYLNSTKLSDLQNDTSYCFAMASMDQSGAVSYMTPLGSRVCGTPQQVWGILDKKNCFIATAAWGTEMDSHVDEFRNFRNKFLLQNETGRQFVNWYYKHSPALATVIREHDLLRAMTRAGLWPILIFVRAVEMYGLAYAIFVSLLLMFAIFFVSLWIFKRKNGIQNEV